MTVPNGEHSAGLSAVLRHIEAAVRHYERGKAKGDEDYFTDAIYRTNQAFEGSLKEAYRVLALMNPNNKKLHQIEEFLESGGLFRKRVSDQFTRYRQDYRNPSTHDYILDFNSDEALLAILSVSAFAKLIVDQIAEKIAFENAKFRFHQADINHYHAPSQDIALGRFIAIELCSRLSKFSTAGITASALEGELAGLIASSGLTVDINPKQSENLNYSWDFFAGNQSETVPVEIRTVRTSSDRNEETADQIKLRAKQSGFNSIVLVLYNFKSKEYVARHYKDTDNCSIYVVSPSEFHFNYGSLIESDQVASP